MNTATARAAKIEALRLAAVNAYDAADRAAIDLPVDEVEALYAAAANAYRALASARSEAARSEAA